MKSSLTKVLFLFIGISIISSCGKVGCADSDATNYDPKVKTKNSCDCLYEGSMVFWYNSSTSQFLINDDAVSLTYYVDGEIVGSSACSVYFNSKPNCGQNGSITVIKQLGKNSEKTYTYSIKDQTGFEYWSGTATFKANTCSSIELQ